jgi:acyl-homoserine-lactone acylase
MYVLSFTDNGPVAKGLLTYSQSGNRDSPHYLDQTMYYSQLPAVSPALPSLPFTESDIVANTKQDITIEKTLN